MVLLRISWTFGLICSVNCETLKIQVCVHVYPSKLCPIN